MQPDPRPGFVCSGRCVLSSCILDLDRSSKHIVDHGAPEKCLRSSRGCRTGLSAPLPSWRGDARFAPTIVSRFQSLTRRQCGVLQMAFEFLREIHDLHNVLPLLTLRLDDNTSGYVALYPSVRLYTDHRHSLRSPGFTVGQDQTNASSQAAQCHSKQEGVRYRIKHGSTVTMLRCTRISKSSYSVMAWATESQP